MMILSGMPPMILDLSPDLKTCLQRLIYEMVIYRTNGRILFIIVQGVTQNIGKRLTFLNFLNNGFVIQKLIDKAWKSCV